MSLRTPASDRRSGRPPRDDGVFGARLDAAGEGSDRLAVTFTGPGTYEYRCADHEDASGRSAVEGP